MTVHHVIPVDDLVEHRADKDCPCHPTQDAAGVWLHHAWDQREKRQML